MGDWDNQREGATQREGSLGESPGVSPGLATAAHCSSGCSLRGPLGGRGYMPVGEEKGKGNGSMCSLEGELELGPLS